MERFIFLNDCKLNKKLVDEVSNKDYINKPNGGIWCSPYLYDYKCSWFEFCEENEFGLSRLRVGTIFALRSDAVVYRIYDYEDLANLVAKYPYKNPYEYESTLWDDINTSSLLTGKHQIDFKAMAKDYDAIFLSWSGEVATRYSTPSDLYGWDIECAFIFNYNAIDENTIEYITLNNNKDGEKDDI